jgi:drug/metabolite transporter (DMT)-like permease
MQPGGARHGHPPEQAKAAVRDALGAAVLFGASPPFAKLLLPNGGPLVVAALLYVGAGIALSAAELAPRRTTEAPLRVADLSLLGPIVILGGIVGPLLMLWGLARVPAVFASLLLNLEAPLTVVAGVLFFGDHAGGRSWVATLLVVGGAMLLSGAPSSLAASPVGGLAIAGACASWALDNNLTQRLSLRDPIAVARAKALAAGGSLLVIVVLLRDPLPPIVSLFEVLLLGFVSYGVSLVLTVRAMRVLGAARQAAYFASAPFVGAVLAVPLLGERPDAAVAVAGMLIAGGIFLLVRERHAHWHTHETIEHDHSHVHDDHHRHAHEPDTSAVEPHSHPHRHAPFAHEHPHVPDLHHRHRH